MDAQSGALYPTERLHTMTTLPQSNYEGGKGKQVKGMMEINEETPLEGTVYVHGSVAIQIKGKSHARYAYLLTANGYRFPAFGHYLGGRRRINGEVSVAQLRAFVDDLAKTTDWIAVTKIPEGDHASATEIRNLLYKTMHAHGLA